MKIFRIKIVTGVLFIFISLLTNQQDVFAQKNKKDKTSRKNSMLAREARSQVSDPYREAIRRFLAKEERKIVRGKEAPEGAYPWQVSLGVSQISDPFYAHFCGGSVYSSKWILTAAHCTKGLTPSQITITAGTNRLVNGATRRKVKSIIVHKNYQSVQTGNDISLIELSDSLSLGQNIRAIPLMTPTNESSLLNEQTSLVVTGWGATQEGGSGVLSLRYLDGIPFVDRQYCNAPLAYDGRINDTMICAGFEAGGGDSCQGDSGGPLTIGSGNSLLQTGIVSWGEGCARPNKVGIYTRVSKYVDWVSSCVAGSESCNK